MVQDLCGEDRPTSQWQNTGAGGWFISGLKGFFEVFAAVVIAFLFVRLQIIKAATATVAVLFSTIVFLSGGILGTFHHLYFTGTPTAILALGATFSALEVVPLVMMGFEAYDNLKLSRGTEWIKAYKWPIYCFIAVAFWNLVGAGIFGFLINPPIALYYMQGLNTTPVHGHTALFGVYGMLGIGLMLFVLRDMDQKSVWKEPVIKFAFWAINIGLAPDGAPECSTGRTGTDRCQRTGGSVVCTLGRIYAAASH